MHNACLSADRKNAHTTRTCHVAFFILNYTLFIIKTVLAIIYPGKIQFVAPFEFRHGSD